MPHFTSHLHCVTFTLCLIYIVSHLHCVIQRCVSHCMICVTLYDKVMFCCITSNVMKHHSSVVLPCLHVQHCCSSPATSSTHLQSPSQTSVSIRSTLLHTSIILWACTLQRDGSVATAYHFKGCFECHIASL